MMGKFEEHCLLALIRSGPGSSAANVYEILCDRAGKEFKFGAVYTTLDRMVQKKWVKVVTRPEKKGGRNRRYFTITGAGRKTLSWSLAETDSLREDIVPVPASGGAA